MPQYQYSGQYPKFRIVIQTVQNTEKCISQKVNPENSKEYQTININWSEDSEFARLWKGFVILCVSFNKSPLHIFWLLFCRHKYDIYERSNFVQGFFSVNSIINVIIRALLSKIHYDMSYVLYSAYINILVYIYTTMAPNMLHHPLCLCIEWCWYT